MGCSEKTDCSYNLIMGFKNLTVYTPQAPLGENCTTATLKIHIKETFVLLFPFSPHISLINYSKNHCTMKKTKQNGLLNWASGDRANATRVEDAITGGY